MKLPYLFSALLFFLNFVHSSHAESRECGEFEAKGTVTFHQGQLAIKVHAGTLSEMILLIQDSYQMKAAPYLDRTVLARGKINRPIKAYRGSMEVKELKEVMPDPLRDARETAGLRLIKAGKCLPSS